jgi:hypothetical protein
MVGCAVPGGRFPLWRRSASGDGLATKIDSLATKVDDVATQAVASETRLSGKIDVQMEHLRDVVRKTAATYGASLESIDRRLTGIERDLNTKFSDRDLVLADHGRRINALEQPHP